MGYEIDARCTVEIEDEDIVAAMSSGCGISFGSVAKAAIEHWSAADLEAMSDEIEDGEIEAVETLLRAMKGVDK